MTVGCWLNYVDYMGSFFNTTFFFNKNMRPLHIVVLFKSIWIARFSMFYLKNIKYAYYV